MPSSQFVVMSREPAPDGQLAALGRRSDVVSAVSAWNTAPEREGEDTLYGPGLELHLPPGQDPVLQMLLTISDHDIAWIMVIRMARQFGWKIVDPQTGRDLSP
jgi:hypothetical protein